jgi:hypothetical protein
MKNKILTIFALILLLSNSLFSQNEASIEKKIKAEINQRKNQNSETQVKDSILSEIAKYINDNELFSRRDYKEIVRQNLNKQLIFDSEIAVANIKVKKSDNIDLNTLIDKSEVLKKALLNEKMNLLGISVSSSNRKYIMQLILTEHYINFKDVSYTIYEPHPLQSNKKIPPTIKIVGNSSISQLYYSKSSEKKDGKDSLELSKKEVQLSNESQFELELDYNNEKIFFYDKNGKQIATIPNIIK